MTSRFARNMLAFTMIELVMVMALLGIVSLMIIPRFSTTTLEQQGFADEVLVAIRYAHKLAITTGCTVQVALNANSYALNYTGAGDCASGSVDAITGGGTFSASAPAGASITGSSFQFDAFGRASSGQTISVAGQDIQVVAETGYAY